jgi:drug/metabolite transporter superfamily protein YnfA
MATLMSSKAAQIATLVASAVCEVGGDALIRAGLRGRGLAFVAMGFCVLGFYGVVLNQVPIDFSKLLGAYVGLFALVSILLGMLLFKESIQSSTWLGLTVVLLGSAIIQWG